MRFDPAETRDHLRFVIGALLCLGMGAAGLAAALADGGEAMPGIAFVTEGREPAWVSVAAIPRDLGGIELLFGPWTGRRIADQVAGPDDEECVVVPDLVRARAGRGSLEEAMESSTLVLLAHVTGESPGFYRGIPATLFRVEPEEYLKGRLDVSGELFFVVRSAEFVAGGRRICRRNPGLPSSLPAIGDRVVLLPEGRAGHERLLRLPESSGLVVITGDRVRLPGRFELDRTLPTDDAGSFLETLRRKGGAP